MGKEGFRELGRERVSHDKESQRAEGKGKWGKQTRGKKMGEERRMVRKGLRGGGGREKEIEKGKRN